MVKTCSTCPILVVNHSATCSPIPWSCSAWSECAGPVFDSITVRSSTMPSKARKASLFTAQDLHTAPFVAYHHQKGSAFCNGVTVTWNLTDCPAGGGGFACVPGSHKSRFEMPTGARNCDADMGTVIQPEVRAGDVLFFMDGAQTHGTHPWQNDHERRSVPAGRTAIRANLGFASPEIYWEPEIVEGMTAEELAVMWGPFSGGARTVPALICEEDGRVHIEGDKAVDC